ncbi:hypothetical protein BO70DRAFT_377286 [Aspergillus heteromorphus CBS 117.55]|uniref:Transmembrane protein n=1 Tax=Aspergillus heteromorphus CBS 117.55 TaxID=1448321 RepID=A0A317WZD9_9EURO|nr:uncharacterized protein BO70DRAFT_377286 [Aspergillus heteromorphus CBS 117.55]PWY90098.1 hypothetical protein BO70DRAFT_377286 [Aspergillus heteromorphus CBS 117.55]
MSYTVPSTVSLSTYGWEPTPTPSHQSYIPPPVSQEEQTDEETVSALWRFLAACSSHLVLVGFLVMPMAFGLETTNSHIDKVSTTIAASVLIAIGYTLSLMLVCFQHQEQPYLLHSLFLPCITTNLLSLLNLLLHIFTRNLLPLGSLETASLSLPAVFTILYAMGALWTSVTVTIEPAGVRDRDHASPLLTEEEMQRQQLQRLLLDRKSRKGPSPRIAQKTFSVNAPERINPGKGWDTFTPDGRDEGGLWRR